MDTNNLFYYVSNETIKCSRSSHVLRGVDFHGGISACTLSLIKDRLWVIDRNQITEIGSHELSVVHRGRIGYELVLNGSIPATAPFALTTNPLLRWRSSFEVSVMTSEGVLPDSDIPASGLPLCGMDWIGLLYSRALGYELYAFSIGDSSSTLSATSYCPDWSADHDDPDGLKIWVTAVSDLG